MRTACQLSRSRVNAPLESGFRVLNKYTAVSRAYTCRESDHSKFLTWESVCPRPLSRRPSPLLSRNGDPAQSLGRKRRLTAAEGSLPISKTFCHRDSRVVSLFKRLLTQRQRVVSAFKTLMSERRSLGQLVDDPADTLRQGRFPFQNCDVTAGEGYFPVQNCDVTVTAAF